MALLEYASTPLSVAMRDGSSAEHAAAEGAGFTTALLDGRINELGYLRYLLGLRTVYRALENVGQALREDTLVAAVFDPRLERGAALDADVAYWAARADSDPGWVSPAAATYAERIGESLADPVRYLAHHYTRYLGDLSGGRVIGRVIGRTYGTDDGLAFYDFAEIPKPKPYKDGYRAALDSLAIDEAQRDRLVAEVKVAFAHNQGFFVELGNHPEYLR